MIKLICFLKHNKNISIEQFHQHWRDVHGKLFADSEAMKKYIARYEQNPRLKGDYIRDKGANGFDEQGHDGVTVIWYHSLQAFQDMISDPYYIEHIIPDEDYLLDRESQAWILVGEPNTIVDKPGARDANQPGEAKAKLLCMLRRSAELSRDGFHSHWLKHHGGLFQTIENLNKDILAYDQNPRLDLDYEIGPERQYDGCTEQWFESLERFFQSLSEPEQKTMVEPDVAYMLDAAGTRFIMSDLPRTIIGS